MMDEDEFFDDLPETILVADIEWGPSEDSINWDDPNFPSIIVDRLKGITEKDFAKEVKMWQDHIKMLPQYNEVDIRKEIRSWDISIPDKDDFNIESFAVAYSRQLQYRNRLTELISIVFAHLEMLTHAQKSLREIAIKLASGPKHDKDAQATFTTNPLLIHVNHAKRLHTYLESVQKNIEFASSQMDKIIREHQTLSRINQTMNNLGMSQMYEDSVNKTKNITRSGDTEIPGRRMI